MKSNRGKTKALPVDDFLDVVRERALTIAKKVTDKHGRALSEHLAKRIHTPTGALTNGTSPNLQKLLKQPGAFFNKRRKPIPLGQEK